MPALSGKTWGSSEYQLPLIQRGWEWSLFLEMGAPKSLFQQGTLRHVCPLSGPLGTFENLMKALYPLSREIGMYAEFGLQLTCVLLSLRAVLTAHINLGLEEKLTSGKGSAS